MEWLRITIKEDEQDALGKEIQKARWGGVKTALLFCVLISAQACPACLLHHPILLHRVMGLSSQ